MEPYTANHNIKFNDMQKINYIFGVKLSTLNKPHIKRTQRELDRSLTSTRHIRRNIEKIQETLNLNIRTALPDTQSASANNDVSTAPRTAQSPDSSNLKAHRFRTFLPVRNCPYRARSNDPEAMNQLMHKLISTYDKSLFIFGDVVVETYEEEQRKAAIDWIKKHEEACAAITKAMEGTLFISDNSMQKASFEEMAKSFGANLQISKEDEAAAAAANCPETDSTPEKHYDERIIIQRQFLILIQAHGYRFHDTPTSTWVCQDFYCMQLYRFYVHASKCTENDCDYPICLCLRRTIDHWSHCAKAECVVCCLFQDANCSHENLLKYVIISHHFIQLQKTDPDYKKNFLREDLALLGLNCYLPVC